MTTPWKEHHRTAMKRFFSENSFAKDRLFTATKLILDRELDGRIIFSRDQMLEIITAEYPNWPYRDCEIIVDECLFTRPATHIQAVLDARERMGMGLCRDY